MVHGTRVIESAFAVESLMNCIHCSSYPSSTKSRSPVSPRGGSVAHGESSDSETAEEASVRRSWSSTSGNQSQWASKKPSSSGSFRRRGPEHIKRTASMDSIDFLHSIPSASDGKGLSEKVGAYHSVQMTIVLNIRTSPYSMVLD